MMSQIHPLLIPMTFSLNVLHSDLPNLVPCWPISFFGFSFLFFLFFFSFFRHVAFCCFFITYMNNESTKYLFTQLWQNSTVTMSENKISVFIFHWSHPHIQFLCSTRIIFLLSLFVCLFVFSDGCAFKLHASYKNNVTLRQHQTRIAQ